jgi:hypothetical protein
MYQKCNDTREAILVWLNQQGHNSRCTNRLVKTADVVILRSSFIKKQMEKTFEA